MPAIPTLTYEKARCNPCRELAAAVILQAVRDFYSGEANGDLGQEDYASAVRFLKGEGESAMTRDLWCAYGGVQPDALERVVVNPQTSEMLAEFDNEDEEF